MKIDDLSTYVESLDDFLSTPVGVDRLRNLILFLAFTGQLVPQDEGEESAQALVARLEAQALASTRTTKVRLADIEPSMAPFELPSSWRWVRLAGTCSHIVDCLHRTPQYSEQGLPAIRTADMLPGRIMYEGARRVGEQEYKTQTSRLEPQPDDIFYSREGNFGIAAVVPQGQKMCLSQRMMQFRVWPGVDPHFFSWALNSPIIFDQARADALGMTVPHINIKSLRQFYFPLAPEDEQLRIVSKLGEIFSAIERFVEESAAADLARRNLSRRALKSIEKDADGSIALPNFLDLVQDPQDLPGLEQAFLGVAARGRMFGRKGDDSLRQELASGDIPIEDDGPWKLPDSWCWVRLEHLADSALGKMLDKVKNKGEYHPYLGNSNVRWFDFDLTVLKEMKFEDREFERYILLPGDVVVCEGGEAGRAAVWTEAGVDMRIQKALHRVRCNDLLRPDWLAYMLRYFANDDTLRFLFTGIGIPHLTGASLKKLLVPLPPISEQDEVIAFLKHAYSRLDEVNSVLAVSF